MKRLLVPFVALLLAANAPGEQVADLLDAGKDAEALAAVEEAAEAGDADAIAMLGSFYEEGRFVEQDAGRAAALFRSAAEKGHANAQWRLGVMIDEGRADGTLAEALSLFRQSSEQGNSDAMTSLAVMYAGGRGVTQDFAEARKYYAMAAKNGNSNGLKGLGVLYYGGEGVAADQVEAMAYWLVALTAGNQASSGYYQAVSQSFDDHELHAVINRANELAEEYGYPGGFTPWNVSDEG